MGKKIKNDEIKTLSKVFFETNEDTDEIEITYIIIKNILPKYSLSINDNFQNNPQNIPPR